MTNKNCKRYRSFHQLRDLSGITHRDDIWNATQRSREVLTKLSNRTWSWPIRELKIASLRNDGGGSSSVNNSSNIIIRESKKAVRKLPLFPLPPLPRLLPLVYPFVLDQFPRSRISYSMNNQQKEHPKISRVGENPGNEVEMSLSPRRVSRFSRGVIFTRPRVSLALLYLKGRLLSSITFEFRIINEIENF